MSKQYSLAEVKEHKDNKSVWIVIHNEVYDVTSFLNEHPGGEEVLLEQAGKEASEAFEDVGHSSDAREMMQKFKIGELIEADRTKPIKKPQTGEPDWGSGDSSTSDSSFKSWIVPIAIGLAATILYRFYFSS